MLTDYWYLGGIMLTIYWYLGCIMLTIYWYLGCIMLTVYKIPSFSVTSPDEALSCFYSKPGREMH